MQRLFLPLAGLLAMLSMGCPINVSLPGSQPSQNGSPQNGDQEPPAGSPAGRPVGDLSGEIDAVLVVNPVINEGTTTTNINVGDVRSDVSVTVNDNINVRSDRTGLVFVQGIQTGNNVVQFDNGTVDLTDLVEGDLVDAVVSVTASGVVHLFPPIRYRISGRIVTVSPGDDLASIERDAGAGHQRRVEHRRAAQPGRAG